MHPLPLAILTRVVALLALCTTFLLTGCISPQNIVLEPPQATASLNNSIRLVRLPPAVKVDDKVLDAFDKHLIKSLAQKKTFEAAQPTPDALNLEYRFVHKDAGDSPSRVATGIASLLGWPFYGVGDGAVAVEVTFRNPQGDSLGRLVTLAPISGAFASTPDAAIDAATSIAKYTRQHFNPSPSRGASHTPSSAP